MSPLFDNASELHSKTSYRIQFTHQPSTVFWDVWRLPNLRCALAALHLRAPSCLRSREEGSSMTPEPAPLFLASSLEMGARLFWVGKSMFGWVVNSTIRRGGERLTGVRRYVCFGGKAGKYAGRARSVTGTTCGASSSSECSMSGEGERVGGGRSVASNCAAADTECKMIDSTIIIDGDRNSAHIFAASSPTWLQLCINPSYACCTLDSQAIDL